MPFVPLTPEEQKATKPPCRDPEHNPPNMMVITHPMKWVCPSCGATVTVYPNTTYCGPVGEPVWVEPPAVIPYWRDIYMVSNEYDSFEHRDDYGLKGKLDWII